MSSQTQNQGPELAPIQTTDAFSNPLFRLGWGSQSPLEATVYPRYPLAANYAPHN